MPYYFSLNCVNNKIRETDWFSVALTDYLIWLRQHQNCPISAFRLDACDQTCQIGQLNSLWKSSIKCCQPIRINKLVHATKSKPTTKKLVGNFASFILTHQIFLKKCIENSSCSWSSIFQNFKPCFCFGRCKLM